jgi:2-polyprenyl-6-methoxyphenol hydroxylase-like FAD-dependent oxidoreductase
MSKRTINIVGAGLGGLTLGRCLKQRGIPAVLYERNASPPAYSYGITLYTSSYAPLLKVLDVTEHAFKSRVAVDASAGGSGRIGDAAIGAGNNRGSCFRAHRGRLEEWLREGLDVRWEHVLQQADRSTEHATTLHFANGEQVQSDIIIGADGVHSSLRKSLLPESQLNILPIVVFNGKRRIDRAVYEEEILPHMSDSNVINLRHGDARLNFSVSDYKSDRVSVSWTYSRPARGQNDALHMPERALSKATAIPDDLYEELSALSQSSLPQPFAGLFETAHLRNDRILHWLMRTAHIPEEDLQALAQNGIVLIGDAAHAHPIVGGNGANMAIEDAVSLAEQIATTQDTDKADLSGWINQRYPIWNDSVQEATENIQRLHSNQPPRL